MSDTDLREFYLRYIDLINNREFDRLHEFVHDEAFMNGQRVSRDEVVEAFLGHTGAVPDFAWNVQDLVIEGDHIAARLVDTGTPVKEWLGLAPTGASVEFTEVAFYEVRDGRFERMWYMMDAATVQRQLGA